MPPNLAKILAYHEKTVEARARAKRETGQARGTAATPCSPEEIWSFSKPPCECHECQQQFRTNDSQCIDVRAYADEVSHSKASSQLENLVHSIHDDLAFLRAQISARGNTILKRWKKSRAKRAAVLQEAMPDMYPSKWPVMKLNNPGNGWTTLRAFRKVYLLPYVNLETLSEDPMRLSSLLHYRTKYKPEDWVMLDRKQIRLGWGTGSLQVEFNSNCVVMYGAEYGKLVPWNPDSAHRWDIIGYPLARLVLEAQQTLLSLLRGVVDILTKDIAINTTAEISTESSASPSTKWD